MNLHFEVIDSKTKSLLYELMALEELSSYYLVGGTALALHLGHRISVDLDFFGKTFVDYDDLIFKCQNIGTLELPQKYSNKDNSTKLIQFNLNQVKIDILQYQENLLMPLVLLDNLRLASIEDIAAMKIRAIEDRTTKKDFYDLYILLEKFSLEEILSFASKKYNSKSPVFAVECIMDIDQADLELDPVSLIDVNWDIVKSRIIKEAKKILL